MHLSSALLLAASFALLSNANKCQCPLDDAEDWASIHRTDVEEYERYHRHHHHHSQLSTAASDPASTSSSSFPLTTTIASNTLSTPPSSPSDAASSQVTNSPATSVTSIVDPAGDGGGSGREPVLTSSLSSSTPAISFSSRSHSSSTVVPSSSPTPSSYASSSTSSAPLPAKSSTAWTGQSQIVQAGTSGVSAMQLVVVDDDHVLIFDKAEANPLQIGNHSAWSSLYELSTQTVRPMTLVTNSFCAGGAFISNGTMLQVSVGGNPTVKGFDGNGLQSIRLFTPCGAGSCDVYEDPAHLHLTSNRWYPSTARLDDGSIIIMGGAEYGGFNDQGQGQNNPTLEFFPPKGNGQAVHSQFLVDALYTNLFPIMLALPDGDIFVAANMMAMTYNWKTNTERRLPGFPNGVRINYPASAAAVLLPLTIANNFTPEILVCGGTIADVNGDPTKLSTQTPASTQCVRMVMTDAGIAGGWIVEQMPEARVMGDGILTPDGKVLLINGAHTGVAGYGNVANQVGVSNADNPAYRATLYDPNQPVASRFTTNFPSSTIERLYHSTASLTPNGEIIIAGSNPNPGVSSTRYATRYEVEIFSPPYISQNRPSYTQLPTNILYGQSYTLQVTLPAATRVVTAVIIDLGFSTHGVHMSQRLVELHVRLTGKTLHIQGPATPGLFPPGYAWLYILADGVPSKGKRVMIGDGRTPA